MLDPDLLAILVCPNCKGPIHEESEPPSLVCRQCGLRYPIRDGIPVLLIDEAESLAADS